MSEIYYTHSEHARIRGTRSISGIHATMEIPLKYKVVDGRRYSIKLGNLKISGNTVIFNLPPIITCPGSGECEEYCYSWVKLHGKFPNVIEARNRNYQHTLKLYFVDDMVDILTRLFEKYAYIKAVRLHESGDFYNLRYLKRWIRIASKFPSMTFYAYTKSIFVQKATLPDNFVIWYSRGGKWDDRYKEEDNQADVIQTGENAPAGYYVCPTVGNPEKVCGRDCSYCMKQGMGRRVAFPIH